MSTARTIEIENQHTPFFYQKIPISIERGEGVYVWDEDNRKYLDFTAGWGVTSIGHANPAITQALVEQGSKIIQNPNSGLTYSPARARLLALLQTILPKNLTRVFFSNSGAEANDAVIKMARKVTQRKNIVSTNQSFHGRTISTASATGQAQHRAKFNPLMPNYQFVPFGDAEALEKILDAQVAAVILEPIQGEGGVNVPAPSYLEKVSQLCKANGSLLIMDEIQTGFCRTGSMFAIDGLAMEADFLTMAKGFAGGFPMGAFAVSEKVAAQFEVGDHGGTYCGNPLGCAVAHAVVHYLIENDIAAHVRTMSELVVGRIQHWQQTFPHMVQGFRGRGLLLFVELKDTETASCLVNACQDEGLLVRQTQGNGFRIFPALNIQSHEMEEGLALLEKVLQGMA